MPGRLHGYETVLSGKRSLTYKVTLVLSSKEGAVARKSTGSPLALRESAHGGPCVDSGWIPDIKSAGGCDRSDSGRQEDPMYPVWATQETGMELLEGGSRSSRWGVWRQRV